MKIKGVILYKCGQNINRVYRLCYTFGVEELYLWNCSGIKADINIGNVFSATGKVKIIRIANENSGLLNLFGNVVAMEKNGKTPFAALRYCDYLLIGGENSTITKKMCERRIGIQTVNNLCLTVDQALAVGLSYAAGQSYSD